MNKREFLEKLRHQLGNLPPNDVEEHVAFYAEMIDDRVEEGLSEAQAVAAMGSTDDIASRIVAATPLKVLVKETVKPKRRLSAWEIVFLILGSPIWLSLLIAAFAVIFSLYISLWAVIVSLWSVFGAVVGCAFGALVGGAVLAVFNNLFAGLALIAGGLVCAGLSVLFFFGCKVATKGLLWLTKAMVKAIKNLFVKKEGAQ